MTHAFLDNGTCVYEIKWLGYEKKADRTWEPAENLASAQEMLDEYHKETGGVPTQDVKSGKKGKKGKRSASDAFDSGPTQYPAPRKRERKSLTNGGGQGTDTGKKTKRQLPEGSWEDEIAVVSSIIEEAAPGKSGRGNKTKPVRELIGLVEWNNGGAKTQHHLDVLRAKAPQRVRSVGLKRNLEERMS